MRLIQFILPFLFIRNWHDGSWELSRARCIVFGGIVFLLLLGVSIAVILQTPVVYTAS